MRLTRDDDTVQIDLHAQECNRANHLAHDEEYVDYELQEDGNQYPVTKTRRVSGCVTGEDWVKVKRRLSQGDRAAITAAAISFRMKVDQAGRPTDSEIEFGGEEYKRMSVAGLVVGIKDWSFDEALSVKNIQRLANEDAELISQRCNEIWDPPRTDDEAKNSLTSSAPPSSPDSDHRLNSDG